MNNKIQTTIGILFVTAVLAVSVAAVSNVQFAPGQNPGHKQQGGDQGYEGQPGNQNNNDYFLTIPDAYAKGPHKDWPGDANQGGGNDPPGLSPNPNPGR